MERRERTPRSAKQPRCFCFAVTTAMVSSVFYTAPILAQNEAGDGSEQIFMRNNCFVCSGQQGFGGIGPSFRNDPFLTSSDYVVGQILMDRRIRPPFGGKLDDKEVGSVATHIRTNWGSHFGAIKPEQVMQIHRKLEGIKPQTAPQTTGSAHPHPDTR